MKQIHWLVTVYSLLMIGCASTDENTPTGENWKVLGEVSSLSECQKLGIKGGFVAVDTIAKPEGKQSCMAYKENKKLNDPSLHWGTAIAGESSTNLSLGSSATADSGTAVAVSCGAGGTAAAASSGNGSSAAAACSSSSASSSGGGGVAGGNPVSTEKYAAIAYSGITGAYGRSWNYPTLRQAQNEALARCGDSGCEIALWVRNGCGSVSVSQTDRVRYGWAWAERLPQAEEGAYESCRRQFGNCRLLEGVCTS